MVTIWMLATGVGDALYFYALKLGDPGQISLIMASAPLVTLVAAVALMGEPISGPKTVGALLVVAGLALIGG